MLCHPQAQTPPQSSLQSAPSSKYLCADTLAAESRMMKSSNPSIVPASVSASCVHIPVSLLLGCIRKQRWHFYFYFLAAGRAIHISEESHAPGRGDVLCRTTASVSIESVHVHRDLVQLNGAP